ncbi:MAG: hypothetical protein K2F99_06745, partial [Muribaculaceae bacterium]|nr:hypothetical protein [Muribaculaceae bacterium]
MLLHKCTPALVADRLAPLLPESDARRKQLDGYARIRTILGNQDAADNAAADICRRLFNFNRASDV